MSSDTVPRTVVTAEPSPNSLYTGVITISEFAGIVPDTSIITTTSLLLSVDAPLFSLRVFISDVISVNDAPIGIVCDDSSSASWILLSTDITFRDIFFP